MSLKSRYAQLRTLVNDNLGWRWLDDSDTIRADDETIVASMLTSSIEHWEPVDEFFVGKNVRDMNDFTINDELDVEERLFRRKLFEPEENS